MMNSNQKSQLNIKTTVQNAFKVNESVSILLTLLVLIVLAVGSPYFFDGSNIDSLQTSIAPYGIVAIGMMVLLISGVFDLSVGSVMCLGGLITAMCLTAGVPVLLAVIIGIAAGGIAGLINGVLVEIAGINPLITTIGMMYIVRGVTETVLVQKGKGGFTGFEESFHSLGQGKFLGIYYMFWIMIILMVIVQLYLSKGSGGRRLYYIGGNREAAKLMGIRVRKISISAFVLSGALAALAGILITARSGMANRYTGEGAHLAVIISSIIGGASLSGGRGSMVGAFFGTVFMTLLRNGFNLFDVEAQWQDISVGAILVIVVLMDGYLALRKQRELGKI